ncbi:rop guanine nucleotide exchange factor 3 [Selaginella moellendorffii]|nr:rop guanine nucleotide exchange factor 3 [Selaginella moellendorffii]|eukprot:XP_002969577.2 rop guanine nucleotide exchange factor 3 [Selaginella moellendorffii]
MRRHVVNSDRCRHGRSFSSLNALFSSSRWNRWGGIAGIGAGAWMNWRSNREEFDEIDEISGMDKAKGLLIRSDSAIFSYEEQHSIDRASCTTSIDGLSRSSHDRYDADLAGSPIDLICERQILSNEVSSSDDDERSPLGWPLGRHQRSHLKLSPVPNSREELGYFGTAAVVMPSSPRSAESSNVGWSDGRSAAMAKNKTPEIEMMKERFSKLLLGEDMSGSGKGVCTALAISNALTNLAASVFGELWRLEPLSHERKLLWQREMNWILSVCDHIVEFVPSFHSVTDGTSLEVMISRPRSDLHINLPALRKLDAMLLEALDSYKETDFWYVDQGVSVDISSKNQQQKSVATKREEDKWWLPVPKIPTGGLSEKSRKALQNQRDCTNQILKAAMAINEQVLSEMQVPDVYWDSLPKSARANLGDTIYYGLRQEHFSPDALLSSLDLSTEHSALEVANRIQSALHIWRKKESSGSHKEGKSKSNGSSRYSWLKVRDLVAECGDKRQLLIERADSLLLCLRQRFPGLPQTVLDVNKIQYNKDVGQAILESYSRVLESLAYSILSRIDDVLYIADMTKRNQDSSGSQLGSKTNAALPTARKIHTISFQNRVSTSTPFATPFASPGSSPSSSLSPNLRRPAGGSPPNASMRAEQQGPCPTLLGSICSAQSASVVEESKKPVKDRPWFVAESRKSFHSPPGRD